MSGEFRVEVEGGTLLISAATQADAEAIARRDGHRVVVGGRIDVNASVFALDGGSSDGAYSLILRNETPAELCKQLLRVLSEKWGMVEGGINGTFVPSRLQLNIGPSGTGDNLPM